MIFEGFESMEVTHRGDHGFVYVLCWKQGDKEVPFYVGQTQAIWGRMNDYHWGEFQASTDFRVGQAVRYLSEHDLRVVSKYKVVQGKRPEWLHREAKIVQDLEGEGWLLLNRMDGYKYAESTEELERAKIERFMERIRENAVRKFSAGSHP